MSSSSRRVHEERAGDGTEVLPVLAEDLDANASSPAIRAAGPREEVAGLRAGDRLLGIAARTLGTTSSTW